MKVELYIEERERKLFFIKWKSDQVLYLTLEEINYKRVDGSYLLVPCGTSTDGATVPWLLRPFFPQNGRYFKASIAHDYLYDSRIGGRFMADLDFLVWMIKDSVNPITATLFFVAVVIGGKRWWNN